jgi:hypothetical protein
MSGNDENIPIRRHSINQLDTYEASADELDHIETECMDVGQDFQFASITFTYVNGVQHYVTLIDREGCPGRWSRQERFVQRNRDTEAKQLVHTK